MIKNRDEMGENRFFRELIVIFENNNRQENFIPVIMLKFAFLHNAQK